MWTGVNNSLHNAKVHERSALLSQEEQLEGKDLAVTKMSINMGKTSNDALGRVNPVERMLFYHKGNLQVGEKVFNAVVS